MGKATGFIYPGQKLNRVLFPGVRIVPDEIGVRHQFLTITAVIRVFRHA